ncbi:hypothetical protein B0H21DRAFT_538275 [Amylocystis lapponica]|nr:hypothetical protein B0H21DRAFT_538275 [Amylocystis lapponica]
MRWLYLTSLVDIIVSAAVGQRRPASFSSSVVKDRIPFRRSYLRSVRWFGSQWSMSPSPPTGCRGGLPPHSGRSHALQLGTNSRANVHGSGTTGRPMPTPDVASIIVAAV